MVKSITLKVISDNLSSPCTIEASIDTDNIEKPSPSIFSLTSLRESLDKFEKWKMSLRQYLPTRRENFRSGAIAFKRTQQSFHLSEVESYQQCEQSKNELFDSFNSFLNHENLQIWLQEVLNNTTDPIRVIIQTTSIEVATLPWEQWSFWDSYYNNNDLVIVLSFIGNSNLAINYSDQQTSSISISSATLKTRILVILGEESDSKNSINLEIDRNEFEKFRNDLIKLGDRTNVDIHVCQPNKEQLEQILEDTWHIIYYGGHSQTLGLEKDGILYLHGQTQVKISELEAILKKNISSKELRLLIANACQGLGTAIRLVSLGLPHIIVMRESIPDDFAHDFLRYLLESFIIGLPVTSAVQNCRPHLREAYDLRHQLPGASLLPALCLTSNSINEIDMPMIPLDGLHPICKEMRTLANFAQARLTLTDSQDILALRVQEYYADLLHHKNKVDREGTKTEINLQQLSCTPPRILGKLIWEITFIANIHGQEIVWGQGYVNIKTGNSELLLDVRPWSWTGIHLVIDGEEIQQLSLPPETEIIIDGQSQKLSFTKIALLTLEQEYRKYTSSEVNFQGIPEVRNFGGWLKDVNKKIFLKELVILQNQGISEDEAKKQAYLKTPFGKARHQLGISNFQVITPPETLTPLIEVIQEDEWTERDYQDLRDSGISNDLWTKVNVPQYIIVSTATRSQ
jgi:hypothetical protein